MARYNRNKCKDETEYWMTLFQEELNSEYAYYTEENCLDYWYFGVGGSVSNMKEYHQMKLLTLLRLLNLPAASSIVRYRGW